MQNFLSSKDKLISAVLLTILLFSAGLLFCLCYHRNYLEKNNLFRYIQYDCNIIAKIDLPKILGPKCDNTQLAQIQSSPYFRNLATFGISIANIDTVYIGVCHHSFIQNIHPPTENAIILLKTKEDVSIDKAIKQTLNNPNLTKIEKCAAYQLSPPDEREKSYLVQLAKNIILLGPKNLIENSILLYKGQNKISKSILANPQMMKLYNSKHCNAMFAAAVIFPKEYSTLSPQNFPKLNSLFLYANFEKQILNVGCNINCASEQDAQKTLTAIQTAINLFSLKAPNKFNYDDISVKTKTNTVIIHLKLDANTVKNFSQLNNSNY